MAAGSVGNPQFTVKDGKLIRYPVAGATAIEKGSLVCLAPAGGGVVPANATPGLVFIGVADESAENPAPVPGAVTVAVRKTGTFAFGKPMAANADLGQVAWVQGPDSVAVSAEPGAVNAGYVCEIIGADQVRVRIDNAVR